MAAFSSNQSADTKKGGLMSAFLSLSLPPARQAFISDIFALARTAGGEARLVGGIVRNGLLAREKGVELDVEQDVDIAVNLPVTCFADAARQQGLVFLKPVWPTAQ